MDCFETLRYEGSRIRQRLVSSLLASRRWRMAGCSSMQKMFYQHQTFALLNISTDWDTQIQAEPATLCSVEFYAYHRENRKPISEISELAFSEAMRDIDLVISKAHTGSNTPLYSRSTIEMRSAVIKCTLDFLGIKNVRLAGWRAIIDGKLAKYSIDIGSGEINQAGGAMINYLPARSRQRNPIFLPYIDDDLKTAEVLSKIILFAEDSKITNKSILSQIK
jgi:hypothetical protein